MAWDDLPRDLIGEISKHLCVVDVYRDIQNVGQDAASLYASRSSSVFCKSLAYNLLTHIAQTFKKSQKIIGGFTEVADIDWKLLAETKNNQSIKHLKEICKILHIPTSGPKKVLKDRIQDRFDQRYMLIRDNYVIGELERLRFRTVSCYSCRYSFGLTEDDMLLLSPLSVMSPKGAIYYRLADVREASQRKFGCSSQLSKYLDERAMLRKQKLDNRNARIAMNKSALIAALDRIGCAYLIDKCEICQNYIKNGSGGSEGDTKLIEQIIQDVAVMRFVKHNTIYDGLYEELTGTEIDIDEYDFSKREPTAHEYVIRIAVREWAKRFQTHQDAVECPGLPQKLRHIIQRWPRYCFNCVT